MFEILEHSPYLFLDICGYAGVELTIDGDCRPCERGFYKSESSQITCDTCPLGYTTLDSGATHIGMCSYGRYTRTLVKSALQKNIFLISQPKHMLSVLK